MYKEVIEFIKSLYPNQNPVPLHAPVFSGNEKQYLLDCIDSTYVSYLGEFVTKFEETVSTYTGAKYSISMVNGTSALQVALNAIGVKRNTEVITQALTFVATANAISLSGGKPVFIDVDKDTLGMSPNSLEKFLIENCFINDSGICFNKNTNKEITACVPVHIFGHPCKIDEIINICDKWNILVIEDSAESLGSFYKGKHTGTFGKIGIFSFNGNKIITTGGGGMIITNDKILAESIKHLVTTAKIPHQYEIIHNKIGYNLRMPNINAAVGFAQMEQLEHFLNKKKALSNLYIDYFKSIGINYFMQPENSESNYWLNSIVFKNFKDRNKFLKYSNENNISTRAVWKLMSELEMYSNCYNDGLEHSKFIYQNFVNIPSSVRE